MVSIIIHASVGPSCFSGAVGQPKLSQVERAVLRATSHSLFSNHHKIIQIVSNKPDPSTSDHPLKSICHCIEYFGGRSEAEWEGEIKIDLALPLHPQGTPIIRMDWYHTVGLCNVLFG